MTGPGPGPRTQAGEHSQAGRHEHVGEPTPLVVASPADAPPARRSSPVFPERTPREPARPSSGADLHPSRVALLAVTSAAGLRPTTALAAWTGSAAQSHAPAVGRGGGGAITGLSTPPPPPPPPPLTVPDAVTGLVSRVAFRAALADALAAHRYRAVVGLRVRGVAGVNRREGEESGDDLLRVAAAAVRTIAGEAAAGRIAATTLAAIVRHEHTDTVLDRIAHALDGRVDQPAITLACVPVDPANPHAALVAIEDALDAAAD